MPSITKLLNSPSFCILPWISLTINTKGEITPCCINHFKLADSTEISNNQNEILNHPSFLKLRKGMMLGSLPLHFKQCSVTGKKTLREIKNESLIKILTNEDISRIENTKISGEIENPKIRYIDIRPSNICNLKCRTCSPEFSSRLHQEERSLIEFRKPFKLSDNQSLISGLKETYFAGGEPLIDEEHYKSLSLIPNDVSLIYNTNFTQTSFKNLSIFEFWKDREKLLVGVSIDDINDRLAYLRHGSDYNKIQENFRKFHKVIPNSFDKIKISITVSIFNILYLGEIIDDFIEKKLVNTDKITLNFLYYPSVFRCNSYKSLMGDSLEKAVSKINVESLRDQVNTFLTQNNDPECDPILFLEKVREKDKLRNENFEDVYPELAKFFI